jgi:aldose 1-epimerase
MERTILLTLTLSVSATWPAAAQYSARYDGTVVRLEDAAREMVAVVVPGVGNTAVELRVRGHNVLRFPFADISEFTGGLHGIPFMAPWAGRLDEQAFYANGTRYAFDMELGNVRGAIPIHGFVTSNPHWQVIEYRADGEAAWVTSRLDFYRQPAWMKQFPFAHTIEITYRLHDGALEVATRIENLSAEPMPVAIGFHPYFRLTDSPRDEWRLTVGARERWLLAPNKLPTGETEPAELLFPPGRPALLKDYNLDDAFEDLVRDDQGRATVSVLGRSQRLDVTMGPGYRTVVLWSPNPANTGLGSQNISVPAGEAPPALTPQQAASRDFICIEPMASMANALNMAHRGDYDGLYSIAPGESWQESFWVRPSGF